MAAEGDDLAQPAFREALSRSGGLLPLQPPFDFKVEPLVTSTIELGTDRLAATFSWLTRCVQDHHERMFAHQQALEETEARLRDLEFTAEGKFAKAGGAIAEEAGGSNGDDDFPLARESASAPPNLSRRMTEPFSPKSPKGRLLSADTGMTGLSATWSQGGPRSMSTTQQSFTDEDRRQSSIKEEAMLMQLNALKLEVDTLPRKADLMDTLSSEVRELVRASNEKMKLELASATKELSQQVADIVQKFGQRFESVEAREAALEKQTGELEVREKALETRVPTADHGVVSSPDEFQVLDSGFPAASATEEQQANAYATRPGADGPVPAPIADKRALAQVQKELEALRAGVAEELDGIRQDLTAFGVNLTRAPSSVLQQPFASNSNTGAPSNAAQQPLAFDGAGGGALSLTEVPEQPSSSEYGRAEDSGDLGLRVGRVEKALEELRGQMGVPSLGPEAPGSGDADSAGASAAPVTADRDLPADLFAQAQADGSEDPGDARESTMAGAEGERDLEVPFAQSRASSARSNPVRGPEEDGANAVSGSPDLALLSKRLRALEEESRQRKEKEAAQADQIMSFSDVQAELERLRKLFDFVQGVLPKEASEAMKFFNQREGGLGHVAQTLGPEVELERHKTRLEEEVRGQVSKLRHEFENLQHAVKAQQRDVNQSDSKIGDLSKRIAKLEGGSGGGGSGGVGGGRVGTAPAAGAASQLSTAWAASPDAAAVAKGDLSHLLDPEVPQGNTPLPYVSKKTMQQAMDGLRADIRNWMDLIHANLLNALGEKADHASVTELSQQLRQAAAAAGESMALFTKRSLVGKCASCDNPVSVNIHSGKKTAPISLSGQWPPSRSGAQNAIRLPKAAVVDGGASPPATALAPQRLPKIQEGRPAKDFPKGRVLRKEQSEPSLRSGESQEGSAAAGSSM